MRVQLKPTGEEFSTCADEDVLTAALRHGVNLRYGCRHGKCSSCKHWLLEGEVDDAETSVYAIPRNEREQGAILLCCSYPLTDVVIEIDQYDALDDLPSLETPSARTATVATMRPIGDKLIELSVTLDKPLGFRAGQYVDFILPGTAQRRSFSLLNAPDAQSLSVFCIKRIAGGAFGRLLETLRVGDHFQLEGPFGTTVYRDSDRPVVLAATGSGIAPMLSLLNAAADQGLEVPIRFYYGARTPQDLVYTSEIQALSKRLSHFDFIPCLSVGPVDSVPDARAGRITQVLAEDLRDTSGIDAYVCGSPPMCEAVRRLLEAKGTPENRIYLDRFYSATGTGTGNDDSG